VCKVGNGGKILQCETTNVENNNTLKLNYVTPFKCKKTKKVINNNFRSNLADRNTRKCTAVWRKQ
jgi:hypothetical protein